MLTELGVRGGPSLSLSLACAETILVIDGHLHWCGPDSVGSSVALTWAVGGSWVVFFHVPGMWACCWFLLAFPGCGVFFLVVCVGCARMWVFGFVY